MDGQEKSLNPGSRDASSVSKGISFRDKLVGDSTVKAMGYADSLTGDKMALIHSNTDEDITEVSFIPDARNALCDPYKNVVVIKLLGKHIGYTALIHRLRGVWRIKGEFHLMDVGYGYFLVKFESPEEKEKVLTEGPWNIAGHYLAVKPWIPSFIACEKSFGTTMVWIRISGLNIWCYHQNAMMRIADAIGKPIKVDLATKSADKGRYARACVEINLAEKLKKKLRIDGNVFDIEYENLQLLCETCNCFGHETSECHQKDHISVKQDGERKTQHFEFGNRKKTAEKPVPLDSTMKAANVDNDFKEGWSDVVRKRRKKVNQKNSVGDKISHNSNVHQNSKTMYKPKEPAKLTLSSRITHQQQLPQLKLLILAHPVCPKLHILMPFERRSPLMVTNAGDHAPF